MCKWVEDKGGYNNKIDMLGEIAFQRPTKDHNK
jgi:hypothetical protein